MKKASIRLLAFLSLCLIIFNLSFLATDASGATEFVCSIMQSGGDYTTLQAWHTANVCGLRTDSVIKYSHGGVTGTISAGNNVWGSLNGSTATVVSITASYVILKVYDYENRAVPLNLQSGEQVYKDGGSSYVTLSDAGTPAYTKVFSHGGITGAIADGSTVWGAVSGSTGVVTHATSTQVLIKSIQGAFQNGEQVYKSGGSLTLSSPGDSAIATAKIDGTWTVAESGDRLNLYGWVTSSSTYVRIYTTTAARHSGVWNTSKYRYAYSQSGTGIINPGSGHVKIDGLQVENQSASGYGFRSSYYGYDGFFEISNCIIRYNGVTPNTSYGIPPWGNSGYKIWNNVIANFARGISESTLYTGCSYYIYNNTFVNCNTYGIGIQNAGGKTCLYIKNNIIIQSSGTCYEAGAYAQIYEHSNNITSDNTSPDGLGNKTVNFLNSGTSNYMLARLDTTAQDQGADLSAAPGISFTTDIQGETRPYSSGTWDIGADEMSMGPDTTAPSPVTDLSSAQGGAGQAVLTWTSPGNDGTSGTFLAGTDKIQYSTNAGVVWSTASAQVTISTGNVNAGNKQRVTVGSLSGGSTYFFRIWIADDIPNYSTVSNGTTVYIQDTTAPTAPAQVRDGTGTDIAFTTITNRLSANWDEANDSETGIAKYQYAISSTSAGGTEFTLGWQDNGLSTSVTRGSLALVSGVTYYFTVRAQNGDGFFSTPVNSDGQYAVVVVPVYGVAEFVCTIKQNAGAGVDYTSMQAWHNATRCDIGNVQRQKRYFHGGITGTLSLRDVVWGSISGSTGSVVTATANYIIIQNSTGTFVSGEQVYRAAGNSVTLSDNGNSLNTLVFSHSGITGAIADGSTVWGSISGSTGTVVHATSSQVLIKWISGIFQSGENAYKDGSNYVTLTNDGNTAIATAKIDGAWTVADTGSLYAYKQDWGTSATNYIRIYTTAAARHNGVWDNTKYRHIFSGSGNSIYCTNYERFDGIQFARNEYSGAGGVGIFAFNEDLTKPGEVQISNCLLDYSGFGVDITTNANHIAAMNTVLSRGGILKLWNNIFTNWGMGIYTNHDHNGAVVPVVYYIYNNTFMNCDRGTIAGLMGAIRLGDNNDTVSVYMKNNLVQGTTLGYSLSPFDVYVHSNNISSDSSSPDGASFQNKSAAYLDAGSGNYLLSRNDTVAKDTGTALSGDTVLAFNTDIQGETRPYNSGIWDIGADEMSLAGDSIAPAPVTDLATSSGGTGQVKLAWTSPGNDGTSGSFTTGTDKIQYSTNVGVVWSTASAQVTVTTASVNAGDRQQVTVGSLSGGSTYYFRIWTGDDTPNYSTISNGATIYIRDTTDPAAPAQVRDGTGADITFTTMTSQLAANWDEANDPETGIAKYQYAISSTVAGGTEFAGWTDNGLSTSVTQGSLTLRLGTTYYFTVRAQNGDGLYSTPKNSDGQYYIDITSPIAPAQVRDGTGTDVSAESSSSTLSANWDEASDPESGVTKYWYAVSSTVAGGTEFAGWTDNNLSTSVTKGGLSLRPGVTYYFSVRVANGQGFVSIKNSDGQYYTGDLTAPIPPAQVRDGTGVDVSYITSSTTLSANWDVAVDTETGILKYQYAVSSTAAGGTEFIGWTDNALNTNVTTGTLVLQWGTTYYFSVRAFNTENMPSVATNSNGALLVQDITAPVGPAQVRDGTGVDIGFTYSTYSLTANWDVAIDTESGILKYQYAISSTTAGSSEYAGWTDNNLSTSITRNDFSLVVGVTYYFTVRAVNGQSMTGTPANSDGQYYRWDITPPIPPVQVRDGTGADAAYTPSFNTLSANWDAVVDNESIVQKYQYAISSTAAGGTEFIGWTNNGLTTNVTTGTLVLQWGATYYFSVRAVNAQGTTGTAADSNGLYCLDITSPTAPAQVRDGTAADITFTTMTSQLSGNWDVVVDTESGLSKYQYAISSTTAGGTEFVGWTDNGLSTSVTRGSLSLRVGATYYFTARAVNRQGLTGPATNSNGQYFIDITSPIAPAQVRDGTGTDIGYTSSSSTLSANWDEASDPETGIYKYEYAISSTTAGGTEFAGWTNNALSTSVTRGNLSLRPGVTYYFSVRAGNGQGLVSIKNSDGQYYTGDLTAPIPPAQVRDGTGVDVSYITSSTTLSANWDVAVDTETGILKYQYAVSSTAAGGTEFIGWTDNALNTNVTTGTLVLQWGTTYYFSVRAFNTENMPSVATNSNGALLVQDITAPVGPAQVRDGTGVDIGFTYSTYSLTANWDVAIDTESGILKYQYAISSTTAGSSEYAGWTDNNLSTSITRNDFSLVVGVTYYFTVRAVNGQSMTGTPANSDGQYYRWDITPPIPPAQVRDGTGADAAYTPSFNTLSANWDAVVDNESVVQKYQYAVSSTAAGGTEFIGWTNNGLTTNVTTGTLVLQWGATYYFSVRAVNAQGTTGTAADSNGIYCLDITSPAATSQVRDGTGTDITFTTMTSQLSSNWDVVVDTESGLSKYQYAISSTTAGGTEFIGWTDNALSTSVTRGSLSLRVGATYYFTARAVNRQGLTGPVANSNGQYFIDITSPIAPAQVRDGTSATADSSFTSSSSTLSANWDEASDPETGIYKYEYAISSTTAGGTEFAGWTNNALSTSVTKGGLSLKPGVTYYFSVRAGNGQGLVSIKNSDGQYYTGDLTAPIPPAQVRDGTGTDLSIITSSNTLSANWDVAVDTETGILKYQYAVSSTVAGGTEFIGWTDNNLSTSATIGSLTTMQWGTTYYFSVRAFNADNMPSAATNSNGALLVQDITAPVGPAQVRDGTGADITFVYSTFSLSANWDVAIDTESGILKYQYAISSTSAGGTEYAGWTDVGLSTSITRNDFALTVGVTYYFTVRAVNNLGMAGTPADSNGQYYRGDITAPTPPAQVRDGTGADVSIITSTSTLSANWDVAVDTESGILKYQYAVSSTTAGGTEFVGWTDNALSTSVTRPNLTLNFGVTYYFSVRAVNNENMTGTAANSNGAYVATDNTPPAGPVSVLDGTGATETDTTYSTMTLSANWDAATDPESGINKYWYAIGTTAGGTDVAGWASVVVLNGPRAITKTGLALTVGTKYYFTVKAENGAGVQGTAANSSGITVTADPTAPTAPASVKDGTGADAESTALTTQLGANWDVSSDPETGVNKYWYAIGTTAGGTDTTAWTDNGNATSITKTGLTLTLGTIYYFSVKAENSQKMQGTATNSNGIQVIETVPPIVTMLLDTNLRRTEISINWTTDEPSTTQVEYGPTTAYGTLTTIDNTLTIDHSVTLTGLTPGVNYHYRVRSKDAYGNETIGPGFTYLWPSGEPAVKVYPNPCDFANGNLMKFWVDGNNGGTVKIYTINGRLTRTLNVAAGVNEAEWDGKNTAGQDVKSGVYIYISDGARNIRGKLVILR